MVYFEKRDQEKLVRASELPFDTKLLLIAAFIASSNPPDHDSVLFGSGKNKKKKKRKRKAQFNEAGQPRDPRLDLPQHLLGPRPFELERLLKIFRALVESFKEERHHENAYAAATYTQIATLTTLKLLTRVTRPEELSNPRLKCAATAEHVRCVAKTLDFALDRYLYVEGQR